MEPAWSYAVVPLASPIRHCQLGLSASTVAAYGDGGADPSGIVTVVDALTSEVPNGSVTRMR